MSFWSMSDGNQVEAKTSYDGASAPIPENTGLLAAIEEAKWDTSEYVDGKFVNLKWRVAGPDTYKGRVIFQKIKVFTAGDTGDKAKRMLAAIDANAGGKLMASGQEPDDMALMSALVGKMMAVKVGIWKQDDGSTGNWVKAVAPAKQKPEPKVEEFDGDIPF